MRRFHFLLIIICFAAITPVASAASGKVLKVLPEFFDLKGRSALSPSLYDRDAYQSILRKNPKQRSAIGFFIQWKAKKVDSTKLKIRVEMRGVSGNTLQWKTLEEPVKKAGWFSSWTTIKLAGEDYDKFGNLIAWRVSLWEGDMLLGDQTSFLW